MRLIDADALNEKLCKTTIFIKGGEMFQRMINDAPTVSAEAEWIPVGERLPDENGWYVTTICGYERAVDVLLWDSEWDGISSKQKVVAWMPLPEPYREDGEA